MVIFLSVLLAISATAFVCSAWCYKYCWDDRIPTAIMEAGLIVSLLTIVAIVFF